MPQATCATASGKAAQTARVHQVGKNRYSGSFYNSDYSISGVVHIVVSGATQTVRLATATADQSVQQIKGKVTPDEH
jgi:hypothetical protein